MASTPAQRPRTQLYIPPGTSVEESRRLRHEHWQSKFRNRGGIYKPSPTNKLADILMARCINGESPSKAPSRAPKTTSSTQQIAVAGPSSVTIEKLVDETPAPISKLRTSPRKKSETTHTKKTTTTKKLLKKASESAPDGGSQELQDKSPSKRQAKARQSRSKNKEIATSDSEEPTAPVTSKSTGKRKAEEIAADSKPSKKHKQKPKASTTSKRAQREEPTKEASDVEVSKPAKRTSTRKRATKKEDDVTQANMAPKPSEADKRKQAKSSSKKQNELGVTPEDTAQKRKLDTIAEAADEADEERPSAVKRRKLVESKASQESAEKDGDSEDDVPLAQLFKAKISKRAPQQNKKPTKSTKASKDKVVGSTDTRPKSEKSKKASEQTKVLTSQDEAHSDSEASKPLPPSKRRTATTAVQEAKDEDDKIVKKPRKDTSETGERVTSKTSGTKAKKAASENAGQEDQKEGSGVQKLPKPNKKAAFPRKASGPPKSVLDKMLANAGLVETVDAADELDLFAWNSPVKKK